MVRRTTDGYSEKSMVIARTLHLGVRVSDHIKVHHQFHTMFMQTHQEILHLKEIFQNTHSRFLDALDYLYNHPASTNDTETATPRAPTSQDHSKRSSHWLINCLL